MWAGSGLWPGSSGLVREEVWSGRPAGLLKPEGRSTEVQPGTVAGPQSPWQTALMLSRHRFGAGRSAAAPSHTPELPLD